MIKLAVIGVGAMAHNMCTTVKGMDNIDRYAVWGREADNPQKFADEFQIKHVYTDLDEMLADKEIDLCYIAVPHSHHYKMAKACLEAGHNVLCEKPFTVNAEQAKKLFAYAEEHKLLLQEAIWTRYMPSRKIIDDIIKSGEIGEVTSLTANLGYDLTHVPRIWDRKLAGGAMLDVGVYLINLGLMVFGPDVASVNALASYKGEVDMIDSITMMWKGGQVATMQTNVAAHMNRDGCIFGNKGYIEIQNVNNPEKIEVFGLDYKLAKEYPIPPQITGYEYEMQACVDAIEKGEYEVGDMPHSETVKVLEIMDDIFKGWGYELPIIE